MKRADMVTPDGESYAGSEIDACRFRRVLSHFCTGVVVVTGIEATIPTGLTCQSFSSLSVDPSLVMFSIGRASQSWPPIRESGRFAVNILGSHQQRTSESFAASGCNK